MPSEPALSIGAARPNQAAHRLLVQLIERVGLHRRSFLERLAGLGYAFSDDDFVNWGRTNRSFPRSWPALRAMVQVLIQDQPPQRCCTPGEALEFLGLVGMPFPELHLIAQFFEPAAFGAALATYLLPSTQLSPLRASAAPNERGPEERLQGHEAHSLPVREGLNALVGLLWAPEVRKAVAGFRLDLLTACLQIEALSHYKELHDLFRQLETHYSLIHHEGKRLPAEQSAWLVIARSEPELQVLIGDLIERATHPALLAAASPWRHKLSDARDELAVAVEHSDAEQLQSALSHLRGILGRETARVKARLVSAAGGFQLARLLQALTAIYYSLAQHSLDVEDMSRFTAFERGVTALFTLHNRLNHATAAHKAFGEYNEGQDVSTFRPLDHDLLALCEELRRLEAPLAAVLRIAG